jgi:hypothetical protein
MRSVADPWPVRRMALVRCMKSNTTPRTPEPDGVSAQEIDRICGEEVFHATPKAYRLTPAGQLLRTIDVMSSKEVGPWSLSELHQSKPEMETKEIETCLRTLERHGIVKPVPGKRGVKWDLTGK